MIKLDHAHFIGQLHKKHFCSGCWDKAEAKKIDPPSKDQWEAKMALESQRSVVNSIYHLKSQLPTDEWIKFKDTIEEIR